LRTVKLTLLVISLALVCAYCGSGEEEVPNAIEQIRSKKFVRIATDAVNIPFVYGEGSGVQGYDVDVAEEVVADIKEALQMEECTARWIKYTFLETFRLLRKGEVEMIISVVAITPEREAEFALSKPYFTSHDAIARRTDEEDIKDLASLTGKEVAVVEGSSHDQFMETQTTATGVTLMKVATIDDALGALNLREVDAVVGDEPIMMFSIDQSFPNLLTTGVHLNENRFAVVMRRTDPELLEMVNKTIDRLESSGALEELRIKWEFDKVHDLMEGRTKRQEGEEALRIAPKRVTINIIRARNFTDFNMDRLDGFQAQLTGEGGTFASQPILTDGNRGSIRFRNRVPPGDYTLKMTILGLDLALKIREIAKDAIVFDMNIGAKGININEREN